MRTVAVNVTRTRWRRSRFFRDVSHRLVAAEAYDDLPEDRVALLAALRRLPAAQREAIALHHLADLPVHEVAEAVGAPVGTVKARLARGRAALAVLLSEPEAETTMTTSSPGEPAHRSTARSPTGASSRGSTRSSTAGRRGASPSSYDDRGRRCVVRRRGRRARMRVAHRRPDRRAPEPAPARP